MVGLIGIGETDRTLHVAVSVPPMVLFQSLLLSAPAPVYSSRSSIAWSEPTPGVVTAPFDAAVK